MMDRGYLHWFLHRLSWGDKPDVMGVARVMGLAMLSGVGGALGEGLDSMQPVPAQVVRMMMRISPWQVMILSWGYPWAWTAGS